MNHAELKHSDHYNKLLDCARYTLQCNTLVLQQHTEFPYVLEVESPSPEAAKAIYSFIRENNIVIKKEY